MKAIVTEKHRKAVTQIVLKTRCIEEAEKMLAELFPDPQPTTERPTEEGAYWFREVFTDEWRFAVLEPYTGIMSANVQGMSPTWVHSLDGEWLRILPPASNEKSMAEQEFQEIADEWHRGIQATSPAEKG